MLARAEDPHQRWVIERLTAIHGLVEHGSANTADLNQRFYLDALADVLHKTSQHISKLFSELKAFDKDRLAYSLVENYELIHLEHERRISYITGLVKDAPLTVEAIARFYKENAWRRQASCQHAIFLYNKKLYHYDNRNPAAPVLTEVTINHVFPAALSAAQLAEEKKARLDAYQRLKASANRLSKDRPHWATPDARKWMETLKLPGVTGAYVERHTNLALIVEFLPKIVDLLKRAEDEWRDMKNRAVRQGALSALLIIGGLALQTGMMVMTRYVLGGTPIALANIIIVMKLALILGAVFLAVSLGFTLYCYVKENDFQLMAADIAGVQYTKVYPSPQGRFFPDVSFTVNEPLMTFFREHQVVLNTAFPRP